MESYSDAPTDSQIRMEQQRGPAWSKVEARQRGSYLVTIEGGRPVLLAGTTLRGSAITYDPLGAALKVAAGSSFGVVQRVVSARPGVPAGEAWQARGIGGLLPVGEPIIVTS